MRDLLHIGIMSMIIIMCSQTMVLAKDIPIQFWVTVPADTPAGDTIYITGSHENLGNWNPGTVALEKTGPHVWEKAILLPEGEELEYKITRGKWENEAFYEKGVMPTNRKVLIDKPKTMEFTINSWIDQTPLPSGITGIVKYHRDFAGKGLNYKRDIIVILPETYDKNPKKRYPVLYMHDGQNIADPMTSYTKIDWGVDEWAKTLAEKSQIPDIIIVGVYNTPDRMVEYSNTTIGNAYQEFLVHELKPFIDKTYHTKPDRNHTAVMGSSMGGLISFYLVWNHGDVFSRAGCLSTWFPADKDTAYKMVNFAKNPRKDIKIYLDHGDKDREQSCVAANQAMVTLLQKQGFHDGSNLYYYYDKGAAHNEAAWNARLNKPLLFLFGDMK